jgi:hypothetical protein
MKAIKILVGVFLALALIFVIVTSLFLSNINELVKKAVEEVGSEVLGTQVTLAEADIQLMEARGSLKGLAIQNPAGFSNAKMLKLDEILLDLDVAKIKDKLVIIEQVKVAGAALLAEQKASSTNFQALLAKLEGKSAAAQSAPTKTSDSTDIRIKINQFDFIDAQARVVSDQFGEASLPLPAINLSNVGGEQGLPPNELAQAVIKPILNSLKSSSEDLLKQLAETRLREELKKQEDKAKEKLKDKEDELKGKLEEKLSEEEMGQLKQLKELF